MFIAWVSSLVPMVKPGFQPGESWWILVFPARFSRWLWPPATAAFPAALPRPCWTPPPATSAARPCTSQRSRATSRRVAGCWRRGRKPRRSLASCAAQGGGAAGWGWVGQLAIQRCRIVQMQWWKGGKLYGKFQIESWVDFTGWHFICSWQFRLG